MNTLQNALLIGLTLLTAAPVLAEENEAAKKDLAALQGEWTMVSGSADGQPMPDEMRKQMKRVCKGDETTTTMNGQVFFKAKITLDPSKKPKTIDYQMTEGFTKGKTQLGIYELDGDTFKSCFAKPGAERPSDFTSQPGEGRTLSVWKREKPAASAPAKSDVAVLQGTWKGRVIQDNPEHPCSLTISGSNYDFRDDADSNVWYKGTFTLREDTTPRQYIALINECPFPRYVGKTSMAIYRVEDGTLTLTAYEPGNSEVPTAFDATDAARIEVKKKNP